MDAPACPCCETCAPCPFDGGHAVFRCGVCGHTWRGTALPDDYYAKCAGRNADRPDQDRKLADRMASLSRHITNGLRILEVGCADGALGAEIKRHAVVTYTGIELSPDAVLAETCLDHVFRRPAAELEAEPFDMLFSFHVLEHLSDPREELRHWRRLLKAEGRIVVEVPHRGGHPLIDFDRHPEHVHQFSVASLSTLLDKAGFTVERIGTGHFESAVYSDSLRVEARPTLSAEQRTRKLLARFHSQLPGSFVVYGVGGDFRNYVEPLLPHLPVRALCDSDARSHGRIIGPHRVTAYDPASLSALPILIASTRHDADIRRHLGRLGVVDRTIVSLTCLYA